MKRKNAPASMPSDLKYSNRIQVINAFLSGGTLCASDVSERIGLSRQTVMKSIQFFVKSGLLVSEGKGSSTSMGGKRPELFALSREKYFLCIALWPQDLRFHLYTIGKQLADSLCLTIPLPDSPKTAIDNAGQLARQILEKNRVSLDNLCAVSLSTSGTMDYKSGRLKYSSQSPQWGMDLPLREWLKPWFGSDTLIFLENAGKMTARPFLLEPELSGKRAMVIFSGWGLCSCMIEKNHILSGKNSLIGEIGHMIIDPNDREVCGCGSRGCLERLVSEGRMRRLVERKLADYPQSALGTRPQQVTIAEIFRCSQEGDPLARELVNYLARVFATALRNISLVFDPDQIVFQGDYAQADSFFDRRLREYLGEFQYAPDPFEIRYDRRPLAEMDALGSYIALTERYFDAPDLYMESEEEAVRQPDFP